MNAPFKPNPALMLAHLEHMFGKTPKEYSDGLVEIAWQLPYLDKKGRQPFGESQLFGLDRLKDAVEFAVEKNSAEFQPVYFGPMLRLPNTPPFGRTGKTDLYVAFSRWTDLDTGDAATIARTRYRDCPPTCVVRTGTIPNKRAQLFFVSLEPQTDLSEIEAQNRGLAIAFDGDLLVFNADRVMRLGGSVAWKKLKKPERTHEMTELFLFDEIPGRPIIVSLDALARAFPPDYGTGPSPGLLAPMAAPLPAAPTLPAAEWGPVAAPPAPTLTAATPTAPALPIVLYGFDGKLRKHAAIEVLRHTRDGGVWRDILNRLVMARLWQGDTPSDLRALAPLLTMPASKWTEQHTINDIDVAIETAIKKNGPLPWKRIEEVDESGVVVTDEGDAAQIVPTILQTVDPQTGEVVQTVQGGETTLAQVDGHELPVINPADWQGKDIPPRNWIVGDWIPEGAVTLLSGDGGTGKSLLALQLAVAVSTGERWLSLPTITGNALVLAAEDESDELHRRLFDVATALGRPLADLDRLRIIAAAGYDAALFEADEGAARGVWTRRFLQLGDLVRTHVPRVVILDTSADLYAANENARRQVKQFINGLARLAMEMRCGIVLLSHPSRAGMASSAAYSGSTAWNGSVRSRLTLARPKRADDADEIDPGQRILSVGKANYGPDGTAIKLRWANGVFEAIDAPGRLDRMAADNAADAALLDGLDKLERQGRGDASPSPFASNYAPTVIAKMPNSPATKVELARAMERLLASGALVVEQVGPPSKRRYRIRREGGTA
jgi:RecA-family ATPase